MSSYLGPFDYFLWYTVIILEFGLLGLLLRSHTRYRAFACYIAFCCYRSVVLFIVARNFSEQAYFYCFWAGSAFASVLVFLVAHEVFERIFAPYATLPRHVIPIFCSMVLLITAGAAVLGTSMRSGEHHLAYGLLMTERVTTVLLGCVFALIVIFASSLGLSWGDHATGIAAGMAIAFVAQAAVTTAETSLPTSAGEITRNIRSLAFISTEVLWINSFMKPEPPPIHMTPELLAAFRKAMYGLLNKRRKI